MDIPCFIIIGGIMETLVLWAEGFVSVFQAGADTFVGLVTGIVPLILVLMTAVNSVIYFIGNERIEKFAAWAGGQGILFFPIRYLVLPVVAAFFLANPMVYTFGRFLPEKYKPAFYDAAVSFVHPPIGIFPHINPGELFVWTGISAGIAQLGLNVSSLAIRYLIVGLIVCLIRGVLTEIITSIIMKQKGGN